MEKFYRNGMTLLWYLVKIVAGRFVLILMLYVLAWVLYLAAQFYRASKTDLYTIYLSDRTRYSYRDRISDLYTKICVEIGWKMYKYKSDL